MLKYFAGKATPEEAMQVDDWANAAEENKALFAETHAAWLAAGGEHYALPDISAEWEKLRNKIEPQPQARELKPAKYIWASRVAAFLAIALTAFGSYFLFNTHNQNLPTLTAQAGDESISLALKDGSHVKLEPQAALIYPVDFATDIREVTLAGNGAFDVDHEATRPFIIHMGQLHVKVLGTSFAISRRKASVDVQVNSGRVAFYNSTDTLVISEGNTGSYVKSDRRFILSPLTGTFLFNDTPMQEVAAQLSARFNIKIQFDSPAFKDCKMSAGFEKQTLKEILSAISATFNTAYKIEGNVVHLSGNACK